MPKHPLKHKFRKSAFIQKKYVFSLINEMKGNISDILTKDNIKTIIPKSKFVV